MAPAQVVALLVPGSLAGLCVEDSEGVLRTVPVWIEAATTDVVTLRLLGSPWPALGSACLVFDEFATYVGIRGAIVRGTLEAAEAGRARLVVTHLSGFSFENTTTSL
jgi:hypothetical protein